MPGVGIVPYFANVQAKEESNVESVTEGMPGLDASEYFYP
jgi:hypothetical protein